MSFNIQTTPIGDFEVIQLSDSSNGIALEIMTRGALLNSWKLEGESTSIAFIEGNDFSDGWNDFEKNGFRSGKMSPFSCRIDAGKYHWNNQLFQFKKFFTDAHF